MFCAFVSVFWLRSLGIFRSLPSGKLVSQTSRLGIRPALPTVQTQGAHPQRSRQTTQLHSASNAGSVPERWLARVLLVRPFAALVWQAVHCHLVRSHSAFAIVADGFDRTSFHGFLAKRVLLRGGRLLKHIGVAAVVAAREISGCGFPAQVAVNALVIASKTYRTRFPRIYSQCRP